jgi:hypothetical protein
MLDRTTASDPRIGQLRSRQFLTLPYVADSEVDRMRPKPGHAVETWLIDHW